MTPVGLIVGGLGLVIAWSAVTGESIISTLRETFTTPASQRTPKGSKPIELPTTDYVPNTSGAGGGMSPGGGDGGGGGGPGARVVGDTSAPSGSNPCAALPVPGTLVPISTSGHRLEAGAAAGLATAEKSAGMTIRVTDSFRTYAQQAACHAAKPNLCTAPGNSCHEKGRAIDVVDMRNQRIIDALTAAGWVRYAPDKEPWHWSYGVRG